MKQLVEDFKNQYDQVDFDITIGAVSTANCKDEVLADVEKAADVFVFADDQLYDLEKQGHYRVLMQHLHMIQKKKMRKRQWRRLPWMKLCMHILLPLPMDIFFIMILIILPRKM